LYYRLYIFALPVNKKGKLEASGACSESPKVQETDRFFLKKTYKNDMLAKDRKMRF